MIVQQLHEQLHERLPCLVRCEARRLVVACIAISSIHGMYDTLLLVV